MNALCFQHVGFAVPIIELPHSLAKGHPYIIVCVCVLMISVALSRKPQSNFTPMLLTVKGFPTKYNRFPYQYLCIHIRQMFRAFVNTLPTNICVYT